MGKKRKKQQIGHLKVQVEYRWAEDPGYQPQHDGAKGNQRFVHAAFNVKESPAALWLHKGYIANDQYMAATKFREYYEAAEGGGAQAFDYARPKVDGGGASDPISVRRANAVKELVNIRRSLGQEGYEIVELVCGQCIFPHKQFRQYAARKKIAICKKMLEYLAVDMGYRSAGKRSTG